MTLQDAGFKASGRFQCLSCSIQPPGSVWSGQTLLAKLLPSYVHKRIINNSCTFVQKETSDPQKLYNKCSLCFELLNVGIISYEAIDYYPIFPTSVEDPLFLLNAFWGSISSSLCLESGILSIPLLIIPRFYWVSTQSIGLERYPKALVWNFNCLPAIQKDIWY